MSRILEEVGAIIQLADSKKVMDKKKCISGLLELYENKEAIKEISKNSEDNDGTSTTWWSILTVIHKLILWEADRLATKDVPRTNSDTQNTRAVLLNTMRYSHESRTLTLKCNGLIQRVLEILHNRKYLSYCDTYLTILTTYILPVRLYQINILPEQWRELLRVCINLYKEAFTSLNKFTIIQAIQMIMQHGYVYTNLLLEIRKFLPLLANILSDSKILEQLEESIYKLANTICYQVAPENRIMLCQFGENILPKIINLSSYDEKYKFMLLFVRIHHPKGVCREDDGAYACNWDTWNGIIRDMYKIILRDSKKGLLFKHFLYFASEVVNQVLQNPDALWGNHCSSDLYAPSAKRRYVAINSPVDMIGRDDIEEAWPMIRILTILFAKYPKRLQSDDFIPLLKVLNTYLMQSSKHFKITNSLYEMCAVLMEIEHLYLNDSKKIDSTNMFWYNIWDILLRSLNTNECESSAHGLAQSFIKYGKMRNTNSLFTLYVSQTIRWSPSSMKTLIMCCEHTPLPDDISMFHTNLRSSVLDTHSVKLHFIEWLLNTPWFKVSSTKLIESLCNILIGIPARFFHEENTAFETSGGLISPIYKNTHLHDFLYDDSELISHKIIESCNLATNFQIDFFTKPTTKFYNSQKHLRESFAKANVNIVDLRNVFLILRKYLYDIVDKENENNDIRAVIMKIALAGKVATTVKKMNIFVEDTQIGSIMCVIENCLQHAYNLLESTEQFKSNHVYLIEMTNAFLTLYETFCHTYTDMTKIIISLSTAKKLRKLFDLLNIEDGNSYALHEIRRYNDNFDIYQDRSEYSECQVTYKCNDICSLNTIRIQTMRTLTLFCCMNTGRETYGIQRDLMKNLMTIDNYDFEFATDFKMAMIVLESFTRYDKEMLYEKYKDTPILFLLDLFQTCKKDAKYLRYILRILSYFVGYAANYNYHLIAIMDALIDLCKLLRNNECGPLVHVEFLKYLSTSIGIKPLLMTHKQYTHYQSKSWLIIENLLTYVQNPLYVLRLQALDCIRKLYSSKSVEYEHKVRFFGKLKEAATNLLSIEKKVSHDSKADEMETRTASVLLAFATVTCSSSTFQNSALVAILQLIDDNYIKVQVAQKILHSMAKQAEYALLNADNLASMLQYWLNTDHTIQTFPWLLTQCASQKEFYTTHINTLVFVEIQNFNIENAKKLCATVGYPFKNVFENIFAPVLSWLLSLICQKAQPNSFDVERALDMLHQLTLNQGIFETIDAFSNLFEANFDKVIVSTVLKLHDEEHFHQMFQLRCQFPRDNLPALSKASIDNCLRYIEEHFMSPESFLYYLAARGIRKLQKILLNLVNNIYDTKLIEHKLKALHHYTYFCTVVMEGLKFDYFDTASMYLIREISYTLIHFIKDEIDALSETACKYFHVFLKYILPKRCVEVKEHLNYYVTSLIPAAQTEKTSTVLNVLEYLIVDQKKLLSDAIGKLSAFPSLPKFKQIWKVHNSLKYMDGNAYNLEKEIRHFLDATTESVISLNLESLSFLNFQLSTRRNELQEMYNRVDSDPIGNYNLLRQLIRKLLEIVRSSDRAISIEATKCLGQLGPIDLGIMILNDEKSNLKESAEASDTLTYDVITLLTKFLVDSNVRLRTTSANALSVILSSAWGQKIVDKKNRKFVQPASVDYLRSQLRVDYISPFIYEERNLKKNEIILNEVFCNEYFNADNTNWTEKSCVPYSEWIVHTTCNAIECFSGYFLEDLVPVCKLSTEMCELILPRIIFLIMYLNKELAFTIGHCISKFFYYHFNVVNQAIRDSPHGSQFSVNCDRNTVCFMLNLVNFIRTQANENIPLELDFICIAKAAQHCSAYFTAFLYAEMSCESLLMEPRDFSNIPKIDYVCEREPKLGRTLQNILRDSCSKIGDPDAIRGCGSSHLRDISTRVQYYSQMQQWDKVLLIEDIGLSSGNKAATREMTSALQQLGFHYLLEHCICAEETNYEIGLECAWRLANWNTPVFRESMHSAHANDTALLLSEFDYPSYHFYALRCFHERDQLGVKNAVECARTCITKALANINLECNKDIYEKLMQLQMLSEIEELCLTESENYPGVLQKWQQCNIANLNKFQYTEPILTQRSIMYQINDALRNNSIIKTELVNTYIEIAEIAQNQGHLPIAARALGTLAKQTKLTSKFRDLLDYQESLLAWKRNDYEVGRYLLRDLTLRTSIDPTLQARALHTYGNWMAETKSENPQTVIEKYYRDSIQISTSMKNKTLDAIQNLHDTQVALARFADAQFEHVKTYMKSSQFKCLKKCVEYSCSVDKFDSPLQDTDLRRAVIFNQKQSTNDAAELQNIEREKGNYLLIAVQYYLLTLCQSENYNLLVFRLIALWLENVNNKEVNELLEENLDKIPSFKFIPLIPQLAAHMNNVVDDFSVKVNKTLMRCALDHPHHTLSVLLALKNLYGDYEFLKTKKHTTLEEEPRILGAKELLTQLEASKVAPIIWEMERLSRALVMFANYDTTKRKRGTKHNIPTDQGILKIKDFSNIFVPTLAVNVRCNGNYDHVTGIVRYLDTFENVGGANAPKKIVCVGTDGIQREQLLKGKDDLRQDCVMQQVFNVMNRLFETNKEAKRRKLKIRTYKVVPLTQRSGIMEWCHNTIPIATILIGSDGNSGLHKKYNPHDYTAATCRKKMADVSKKSNEIKLQQFLECCRHMRPAFHNFFIEKYPSPETWYEKRLAYTRSVATTSIAGYILGLGDRHLSNILIDQLTAEVIHIDFGIAFEQGKVLPVPETVPFRLTRDIEVAMGVSGVEGIMRRGCEEILTVLRDQRQIIITLLQVLLYDPLFTWAITPAKAYTFQTGNAAVSSEDVEVHSKTNKTAERALLRIEQKLQGIEEGLVFSVPGQVEQLIQQARDPSNLCRLFCGWQPYL